jgi:hypothetical protein
VTRIVLHIGAAKTATTYIQHGLWVNAELLAAHGVYVPLSGRSDFAKKTVAHHNLGWEFLEEKRFKPQSGGWGALAEELKTVEAETVIISTESLERMTYTPQRRKELEERIRQLSDDVTVVYVVRDQLSSLNSLYTQNIKSFRTTQNFNAFVVRALASGHFDLHKCFRTWYDHDALSFQAVPFTTLVAQDPLVSFLSVAKVDVPTDQLVLQEVPSNVSPGPIAVEAAKLLGLYLLAVDRKFVPTSNRGRRLYRQAALRARRQGWCEEKYWGWTPQMAAKTAADLQPSNQQFAQAAWGGDATLELPTEKPLAVARLMALDPATFKEVQTYVDELVQRYLEMKTGQEYLTPDAGLDDLGDDLGDDLDEDDDDNAEPLDS